MVALEPTNEGPRQVEWTLGERIRKARRTLGMTPIEFGALFGVTDKAVSTWETGRNQPRDVWKFARELERHAAERNINITAAWVLGLTLWPQLQLLDGSGDLRLFDPDPRPDLVLV